MSQLQSMVDIPRARIYSANMSKATWIRDGLHELRRFAKGEGMVESDKALRDAIVRVSREAGIATKLRVQDLVDHQLDDVASSPEKASET